MADFRQGHLPNALAHAGGGGTDVDLSLLHTEKDPANVLLAHAGAGVLKAAGNAGVGIGVEYILQRVQAGGHIGVGVGGLAVGQHVAGLDGVAAAELPGVNAHHFGQEVDVHLSGKAALGDAEAPEGAGDHVVGVHRHTEDMNILVVVGPGGVGAGPVKHRHTQECVGPGVGDNDALHAGENAVLITGACFAGSRSWPPGTGLNLA